MTFAVELLGVKKRFGKVVALEGIDLSVREGEFLALLGPSGCGKTTTLRIIAGFLRPDSGRVLIGGRDALGLGFRERGVGIVFQNYALFPNMDVFENVAFGLRVRKLPEEEIRRRVFELLEMVRLVDKASSFPHELSGGQQQRVALARALAIEPRVLLLDEPLSALDAKVRNALRFEIKRIQRECGTTTIYVTHDQEEALSISDRIAVMSEGRIVQLDTPAEIYRNPVDRFVADFVGLSNFLEVEVTPSGEVLWRGRSLGRCPRGVGDGGSFTLAVRPEYVRMMRSGELREGWLRGRVVGRVFLGSLARFSVEVEGFHLVVDVLASSEEGGLREGEEVVLGIDMARANLLRG